MPPPQGENGLRFLERPRPIHFIGDSHVGMYDGLLLEDSAGRRLLTRSEYHRYLQACMFTDFGGKLHEGVWRSLAAQHFLAPRPSGEGAPFLPTIETLQNGIAVREGMDVAAYAADVPLVIVVGEIDSRNIIGQLNPSTGLGLVDLPAGIARLHAPKSERTISEAEFMAFLRKHFEPLERGLRGLREHGLRSLFLHDLPPPTPDDADAARVLGFPRPARLRYSVVCAINRYYRALCAELGIGFVDLWAAVTQDDVLDPAFYVDGLHLSRAAALIAVGQIHRSLPHAQEPIP